MNLRPRRKVVVAGWLLLVVAVAASGAELAAGLTAYQLGDYAAAERTFRRLADDGEALAQAFLGEMYLQGHGVGRDEAEAARLFQLAADQGHPGAQLKLARLYWQGRGVEQSTSQALYWMRRAADAGNLDAQFAVAGFYDHGPQNIRDAQEAERWYRKAAARGHPQAQNRFRQRERRELARLLAERDGAGAPPAAGASPAVGAPPAAGAPGVRYQVQLGAYRTFENARRGWSIVRQRFSAELTNTELQIVKVDIGARGGLWYRLRAGAMPSRDRAESLCAKLRARPTDIPCLVVQSRLPATDANVAVVYPPG